MPIVEYYSPSTHTIYQFYARSQADLPKIPRCPDGKSHRMQKTISSFAITGRARESDPGDPDADANLSPAQEAAMMELAAKMEGMDEANPDPKALGRLMREMTGIMGKDQMPGGMEEMIRRLEAGEDPEKLEAEFGDLMDGDAALEGNSDASGSGSARRKHQRLRRQLPARRDPTLYELRDFL